MAGVNLLAWVRRLAGLLIIVSLLAGCAGFSFNLGGEPVTLKFVYLERAADYESLAKQFHEENPNITIELAPVPTRGNVRSALMTAMAEADTFRLPIAAMDPELVQAFLPLDSMISTSTDFPQADLFPGSLEALRLDGKQYGLPAGMVPFVMFYLPAKFEAFGVNPPPPNWTLEDFVALAMAVHNPDDSDLSSPRYSYGFCSHPDFTDGAVLTYLFGGGLFDSLTAITAPTLNRRENVDAISWYASLKNDFGLIPDRPTAQNVGELVARSNCGFWIDWLDGSIFGGYRIEGATPLPLPGYQKQFNVANIEGYFIRADTLHPEESWKWISFLMEQQAASGEIIPPLKSQVASEEYGARVSPPIAAVARSLPADTVILGLDMYRNERFGGVLGLFSQAVGEVFDGTLDAQTALDAAQAQAEDAFR